MLRPVKVSCFHADEIVGGAISLSAVGGARYELVQQFKDREKVGLGIRNSPEVLVAVLGHFRLLLVSKLNANVLEIGTNWMASITNIAN